MSKVKQALGELRRSVLSVVLFQKYIDTLVVFSLSFLATVLVSVNWLWAFVPTVLYLFIHCWGGLKEAKLAEVEAKVPEMEMQLRTVADNEGHENAVMKELQDDVLQRMKKVKTSAFVHFGRIGVRVMSLVFLSLITIFVSASNIQFMDLPTTIDAIRSGERPDHDLNASLLELLQNDSEYQYGNRSVAELGYEELELKISPVMSEIEIGQVEDPTQQQFSERAGVAGKAQKTGGTYQESEKVKENYELVQKYFADISGK